MSMDKDWDSILSKLHENSVESNREATSLLSSVASMFAGGVVGAAFIALSAWILMVVNSILIDAWPDMVFINPGIGFVDSFILSTLLWFLFFIKKIVCMALEAAGESR